MGQLGDATDAVASLEAVMANKDKGGGNTKKVAAKNLKEKRAAKKAKRSGAKPNTIG